ncbi:hypothetical protein DMA11_18585 [Marinilabiliaceae bacterium JC017]|nr:hypothetical protein DMA11_18585 [Marinilabiliaceae bacterium JC017]
MSSDDSQAETPSTGKTHSSKRLKARYGNIISSSFFCWGITFITSHSFFTFRSFVIISIFRKRGPVRKKENKEVLCILNYRHHQFEKRAYFRRNQLLKSKIRLSRKEIVFSTVNFSFLYRKDLLKSKNHLFQIEIAIFIVGILFSSQKRPV